MVVTRLGLLAVESLLRQGVSASRRRSSFNNSRDIALAFIRDHEDRIAVQIMPKAGPAARTLNPRRGSAPRTSRVLAFVTMPRLAHASLGKPASPNLLLPSAASQAAHATSLTAH